MNPSDDALHERLPAALRKRAESLRRLRIHYRQVVGVLGLDLRREARRWARRTILAERRWFIAAVQALPGIIDELMQRAAAIEAELAAAEPVELACLSERGYYPRMGRMADMEPSTCD